MTANGWIQILLFAAIIFALTKPLGIYMFRVFEGDRQPLPRFFGPIERLIYRLCGVDPKEQQDWKAVYCCACSFSARVTLLVTYAIERLQHVLPLNPQNFGPVARGPRVQHCGELHDQYQLAGVRWRIDHELSHADGGACLAQLHLGGGRHRHRARPGARDHLSLAARQLQRRSATSGSILSGRLFTSCCLSRIPVDVGAGLSGSDPKLFVLRGSDDSGRRQADPGHGTGGVAGSHQRTRHQRRRILQRQQRPSVREPHSADEFHRDGADLRHSRGADLHVRPHGAGSEAGLGALCRDGGDVLHGRVGRVLLSRRTATR